jgi:hypothetical protein
MKHPLSADELRPRTNAFSYYAYLLGVIKGGVYISAALALASIATDRTDLELRLLLWTTSLLLVVVAGIKWSRGMLLNGARQNFLDTMLPTINGIFEIVMFVILEKWHAGQHVLWWYVALCLHNLTVLALIVNRYRMHGYKSDYTEEVWGVVSVLLGFIRRDMAGVAFLLLASVLGLGANWGAFGTSIRPDLVVNYGIAVTLIAFALYAALQGAQEYSLLVDRIDQLG